MTSSSSYLSVLRIGPTHDNVSATILKNAVLDHFHKKQLEHEQQETQIERNSNGENDGNGDQTPQDQPTKERTDLSERTGGRFKVSNRYFQAQLLFKSVEQNNQSNGSGTEKPDKETYDTPFDLYHKEDGILLAFDATRSNPDFPMSFAASFDSLESVHNHAVENDAAGDLLRLCVGITMGPMDDMELRGRDYEQEYSRRILWCLDRGYEYVEADLSAAGISKGHDVRDKEGFARIIEAISGTVWSSAVMEKQKVQQLKQSYQETVVTHRIEDSEEKETENSRDNPYIPPDPSLLSEQSGRSPEELSDEARLEKAREALLQENGEDGTEGQLLADGETAATPIEKRDKQRSAVREEREQERRMDQLDGALKQAASIRDMSRSGKLTDQERRQRAGDAAMVLMNLMNSMGVADEGSTDEAETDSDKDA